jgi:nuclear transport factor 2 (NTF2) superfamily protein
MEQPRPCPRRACLYQGQPLAKPLGIFSRARGDRRIPNRKWANELDYRLIKELWAFHENRISVRFQYEWHDDSGHWFRSHGNEQWEFDGDGLMSRREASVNDVAIAPEDRKFLWPAGPRPAGYPGLSELGL